LFLHLSKLRGGLGYPIRCAAGPCANAIVVLDSLLQNREILFGVRKATLRGVPVLLLDRQLGIVIVNICLSVVDLAPRHPSLNVSERFASGSIFPLNFFGAFLPILKLLIVGILLDEASSN
jgi:hypothetical protein